MAAGQFLDHVVDATLPVLKICLLGAVGAGLARGGILDQGGRRTLSKLIYCLFTPTLTFTKLAPVLSGQHLLLWMPLVVNMFVSVGAGLLLGGLLLVLVRPPPGLRRHVVVATALGNAGNLPLVLCAALVRETGGKLFGQEVLSEDLAIAYVAMGIWAATVTHFTIGSELLKLPADQQQQHQQQQQHLVQEEDEEHTQQLLLGGCKQTDSSTGRSWAHAAAAAGVGGPVGSSEGATASCVVELGLLPAPQQQQPQRQQPQQQRGQVLSAMQRDSNGSTHSLRSLSHGSVDCLVLAGPAVAADSSSSKKGGSCGRCGTDMPRAAQGVSWQCPLCGAPNKAAAGGDEQQQQQEWQHSTAQAQEHVRLLGSAAGAGPDSSDSVWLHAQQQQEEYKGRGFGAGGSSSSSSRLRRVGQVMWDVGCQLASPPMVGCMLAVVVGLTPPLRDQLFAPGGSLLMVQDCISMFGDCCIPCLLLMLGATLSKGPGQASPPWRVVAAVAAARLVLLPLLGTGWLVMAKTLGWYHAPDKMFVLVMLIQNAVPTALNVHTLATLHNNKEAEMGALLFWQYLAACVTLPAALSCFLWLLNTPAMST